MITIIFAPPGVGKSTLCARYAWINHFLSKFHLNTYDRVYCNFPVKYTYQFEKYDLGVNDLAWDIESDKPIKILILYDEASIDFHARNYKQMTQVQISHFKEHRHFDEDFVIFSQSFDVDKVIRELSPRLFYLKRSWFWPHTVKALHINKYMNVNKDTKQMEDGFEFDDWYIRPFTTKRYYLPFYWGLFNSWERPELKKKRFEEYEDHGGK